MGGAPSPPHGQDPQPKGARQFRGGSSDLAIAYDAQGRPFQHLDIERRPLAGLLIAQHPPQVFGKEQHRAHRKFSQRSSKDPAPVCEGNGTGDQFRRQDILNSRGERVHPLQVLRLGKQASKRLTGESRVDQHIGVPDVLIEQRAIIAQDKVS